jgi:hypothetical protein
MLPEDGTGTQEKESGEREKSVQPCLLLLELQYAAERWNGYAGEREREWRKREKLSAVFVTFRVTVCCRKMEQVPRRERESGERESKAFGRACYFVSC